MKRKMRGIWLDVLLIRLENRLYRIKLHLECIVPVVRWYWRVLTGKTEK